MRPSDGGRLIAFTLLSAAIAQQGFAAKITDLEHTRIEYPRPAEVPGDAAMEAAGAVIGKIDIDIRNIFDESDARESNGLYRLPDRLDIPNKAAPVPGQ